MPYPDEKLESRILSTRVPDLPETLRKEIVSFVQDVRSLDLKKVPSISETIDWAKTLVLLHSEQLDPPMVKQTLNVLLKFETDIEAMREHTMSFINKAHKRAGV